MSLKEFFAQSILIAQSAVIAIYNRTELTKFFKTQVATLLMVFTHKRKNRADKTTEKVLEIHGAFNGSVELKLLEADNRPTCFPSLALWSLVIVASTVPACSPPITEIRAFGHMYRKRGLKKLIELMVRRHFRNRLWH